MPAGPVCAWVGSTRAQGMSSGSWSDLVMSPRGIPQGNSTKTWQLEGTFLEPRTLHKETRANTRIMIVSSTYSYPRRLVLPGECGFIFRTSIHVCISFTLFCVFHFK